MSSATDARLVVKAARDIASGVTRDAVKFVKSGRMIATIRGGSINGIPVSVIEEQWKLAKTGKVDIQVLGRMIGMTGTITPQSFASHYLATLLRLAPRRAPR